MTSRRQPPEQPTRGAPVSSMRNFLTVAELCAELGVARSTFNDWRAKGTGPRCIKIPNGELRIRRTELDRWLDAREEAA